jgi:hypothetical protein
MSRRFLLKKNRPSGLLGWPNGLVQPSRPDRAWSKTTTRPNPSHSPLILARTRPPLYLSLVASLTLQHRRSPRRLPANSGAGEPGVPARLDVLNNLPQVDLIFVASRGRPDPETLSSFWSWSPMVSGAAALSRADLSSSSSP